MASNFFNFKQFTINQEKSAFKIGTDGVLLGASADLNGVDSVLDIGTGTGLIAIMIAQRFGGDVFAIEPDNESFNEARENVSQCKWSDSIWVLNTDLQHYFPEDEKFDLIIVNPPYFNDSLKSPDQRKTAARHNDTLSSKDILTGVTRLIKDNGSLQIIMPYVEGNVFIAEAQQFGLYCNSILKIRPLPTADVRRLIMKFSKTSSKVSEKFLTIESGRRYDFTEDYINLTKEFYLKL